MTRQETTADRLRRECAEAASRNASYVDAMAMFTEHDIHPWQRALIGVWLANPAEERIHDDTCRCAPCWAQWGRFYVPSSRPNDYYNYVRYQQEVSSWRRTQENTP